MGAYIVHQTGMIRAPCIASWLRRGRMGQCGYSRYASRASLFDQPGSWFVVGAGALPAGSDASAPDGGCRVNLGSSGGFMTIW